MAIEKVKAYFKKYGMGDKVIEFDSSCATVELAARTLGIEEARIAKTLSFKVKDKYILIVMTGDVKIDNAKYKQVFNVKASMIPKEDVERIIGHDVGGVCPFEVNKDVDIYLDNSIKRFDIIYPACGSSNSAIGLTPLELEKYSNAVGWLDVTKISIKEEV